MQNLLRLSARSHVVVLNLIPAANHPFREDMRHWDTELYIFILYGGLDSVASRGEAASGLRRWAMLDKTTGELVVLHLGIIDFLQPWTPSKVAAMYIKSFEFNKVNQASQRGLRHEKQVSSDAADDGNSLDSIDVWPRYLLLCMGAGSQSTSRSGSRKMTLSLRSPKRSRLQPNAGALSMIASTASAMETTREDVM
ncbi:hypothetical protein AK812_SmicGene41000 [Symbiodinium microadriaticum]|uniref:PIPK domain-containing protein n=1 Tax=Symbiodinium microadriaticum TaxID=2951 RepID=A0A1Q9C792_SYMMI|nr:hypothetical protein AK812_SmicGene41000 [Symbiodinium microadriaticum]